MGATAGMLAMAMAFFQAPAPAGQDTGANAAAPSNPAPLLSLADGKIMQREGYLVSHPDQYFRKLGSEALLAGRVADARTYFQRAARYADKLSQAALAELWWEGHGGPQDRAIAYAWMDLAAERGTPYLLAKRERYWGQLDAAGRQRALDEGRALHARYRDAVAKPRLEAELHRGLSRMTGSRAGWSGNNLQICIEATASGRCVDWVSGEQYYAAHHWQPREYWRVQDHVLLETGRSHSVQVGPLEGVPAPRP